MTVVAGCTTPCGVFLVTDCRATIPKYDGRDIHVDNLQKLFFISPWAAVGFTGDVPIAGELLASILRITGRRVRPRRALRRIQGNYSALALLQWLPRHLRWHYKQLPRSGYVGFMVGSLLPTLPNIVERERAFTLLNRIITGKGSAFSRSWLPASLFELLQCPPQFTHIKHRPPRSLLYVMESPSFVPQIVPALNVRAIGDVRSNDLLDEWADMLVAGPEQPSAIAREFQQAVAAYVHLGDVKGVGGLFPCVSLTLDGGGQHGLVAEIPFGSDRIELRPSMEGRWCQINHRTGREVLLEYPWEARYTKNQRSNRFDDMRWGARKFYGKTDPL